MVNGDDCAQLWSARDITIPIAMMTGRKYLRGARHILVLIVGTLLKAKENPQTVY